MKLFSKQGQLFDKITEGLTNLGMFDKVCKSHLSFFKKNLVCNFLCFCS